MDLINISRDVERNTDFAQQKRNRRRKARRRAKRKLVKDIIISIVILALAIEGGRFLIATGLDKLSELQSGQSGQSGVARTFSEDESDIEMPTAIDTEEELQARISELVAEHPECSVLAEQQGMYPEDLLKAVCNNEEMIEFALGYPAAVETLTSGGEGTVELSHAEKKEEYPLFLQWDERWGYQPYGSSVIGLSGCGPTCLAMVATALTGEDITPDVTAAYAMEQGYYLEGTGTKWSLMDEGASSFGVTGTMISNDKRTIFDNLEAGNPIICSMGPGYFTAGGHFIVLVGTEGGRIIVNDPNSREKSEVLWSYDTISSQMKSLWVYEAE